MDASKLQSYRDAAAAAKKEFADILLQSEGDDCAVNHIPTLADAVAALAAEVERLQAWKREFVLSLVPQLDYLAGAKSCPCGAREESLGTHSHASGCEIGEVRSIMANMLKGKGDA